MGQHSYPTPPKNQYFSNNILSISTGLSQDDQSNHKILKNKYSLKSKNGNDDVVLKLLDLICTKFTDFDII